jgi:hypothetical protein
VTAIKRARTKRAPRAGVNVESSTPTLYRQLIACATPYVAKRADDGSLTILDEGRWSVLLSAYDAKEITMTSYAHTFRNPSFRNSLTGKVMPNDTGWQDRHMSALRTPRGFEAALRDMIEAWARYADEHQARYGSGIGKDYVLGDAWMELGRGILGLLDGGSGRFDCGTLDGFIRNTLTTEGYPS